jgi:hypothetical protein
MIWGPLAFPRWRRRIETLRLFPTAKSCHLKHVAPHVLEIRVANRTIFLIRNTTLDMMTKDVQWVGAFVTSLAHSLGRELRHAQPPLPREKHHLIVHKVMNNTRASSQPKTS